MRLRMYDLVPLVGATTIVIAVLVWDLWLKRVWEDRKKS
jgi:hypothetical protein